eukprot:750348-Hanusia_phi.AAC.1
MYHQPPGVFADPPSLSPIYLPQISPARVKHKSLPNSLQLDPVRVLLESIRRDIGDDKVTEKFAS